MVSFCNLAKACLTVVALSVPVMTQTTRCQSSGTLYPTLLPACNTFASSHSECFALPGPTSVDTPAFKNCICNQDFFDLIVDCQSETRVCLESDEEDGAAEQAVENWHAECNTWIDFSYHSHPVDTPCFCCRMYRYWQRLQDWWGLDQLVQAIVWTLHKPCRTS